MGLPFIFYNYPVILLSQDSNSLRPAIFGSIPVETVAYGYYPNDLSTSVRTNVTGTTRGSTSYIAAGTYSSPITLGTSNREYILSGDVTFDGAGFIVTASNITLNLSGHTLKYMENDLEGWQTGTVLSKGGGTGTGKPTMVSSGVSGSCLIFEFLNGAESGNWYELSAGSAPNFTLDNYTISTDTAGQIDSWENGGPASGDLFRTFDPRSTFGIGSLPSVFNLSGLQVINGTIVQGAMASHGRGYSTFYNIGCAPISSVEGNSSLMAGGLRIVWSSANTMGIYNKWGGSCTIHYCELEDSGTFVANRQRPCGAIHVAGNSQIRYNRIISHRHTCMELNGNGCTIEYNDTFGDSRATNAATVNMFAIDNTTVRYNNIYKVGEHPIGISLHDSSQNNTIYGNWCESKSTRSSAEYGWNYAVAVSNRWAYSNGPRTASNNLYNNTFITYSEDGTGANSQSRGKTMFFAALYYTSGENVSGNFIGAYNTDNRTECHCVGLSTHTNTTVFRDNIIVSSHNNYWIGDNYGDGLTGGRFIGNTLVKAGADTGYKTFMGNSFYSGGCDFISENYTAGTTNQPSGFGTDGQYSAMDSHNYFNFGYLLTVSVTQSSVPVSGATVLVYSSGNKLLRNGYLTNSSGQVVVDVPTFYRQGPSFGVTSLTPLTVQATSGVSSGSGTISPVSNDSITIAI